MPASSARCTSTPASIDDAGAAATRNDLDAYNRLCRTVHGFARSREVEEAVETGRARVVVHQGRITGYATDVGFFAHAIAETNRDLIALIAAAPEYSGAGLPFADPES